MSKKQVVVSFTLPSNGERWNWPVEGEDGIDVAWTVREMNSTPATPSPVKAA